MQAKDIMTADPICCTVDTPLMEAARIMAENDCGALPVVDDQDMGRPLGIITDRDIVCRSLAVGKDPLELKVCDCMSGPCVTIAESGNVEECCDAMEANQVRRLVVTDDEGRCIGIIAQADIARAATEHQTAEVVREISLSSQAMQSTF